jgi:transcriptional regulator with PAS, ATPase and Fis domain
MSQVPTLRSSDQFEESFALLATDKSMESDEVRKLLQVATDSLLGHIATMCEGALIVDKEARVVWMNERYPHRLGITDLAGTIGKPVEQILPNSLMRTVVETGRPIMLDIMEFGAESFVVVRLPLRDNDRNVIGAIGIILLDNALGLTPLVGRYNRLRQNYSDAQNKLAMARRAKYTLGSIVGSSPACIELKLLARRAARSNAAVLIQGETGTGKELLAQAIHNASDRASKPFVAVNIAAIPENLLESEFFGHAAGAFTGADRKGREGKFKMADGGTLFLDEIGDMSAAVQAKLLRVLQEGEFEALGSNRLETVDVRVVAATSCDLQVEMAAGRFRPDLFYRLNVVSLHVPPLRERPSDLPALCEHLLDSLTQKLRLPPREIAPEALNRLAQHAWPGNIRELSNTLERVLLMNDADTITQEAVDAVLPAAATSPIVPIAPTVFSLVDTLRNAEKNAIAQALLACAGNRTRAAQQLGISRTSLYEKVALHGLS